MKFLLLFIVVIFIIILYKNYKSEYFNIDYVNRDLLKPAICIKDDIELSNSYFLCQMNKKYSPVNITVNIIKYQNIVPFLNKTPSTSFNLLSTLTPSLVEPPLFSDNDFKLIGTTTNSITKNVTLNDSTKIMKVFNYSPDKSRSLYLFDLLPDVMPIPSSLDDNNFLYLPDCIVNYVNYLNDLQLLHPNIDVNKIDTLPKIASQFNLYLQGQLIPIVKPESNTFRLQREIIVIFDYPNKKNIVNIQFNQTITWYDSNNIERNEITTNNINTQYDYLIINSCNNISKNALASIINTINTYGSYLKSRNLINDYQIDDLLDKINNLQKNDILYVNYFFNKASNNDDVSMKNTGIQLVKRINGNLININYFDVTPIDNNVPFSYYKNICQDPPNNLAFKGRCYSDCPNGYSSIGLACINNSKKDLLFNPDSNYCSQVCNASDTDIRNFDPVLQQACWCKSASCNKCGEFSIDKCKC